MEEGFFILYLPFSQSQWAVDCHKKTPTAYDLRLRQELMKTYLYSAHRIITRMGYESNSSLPYLSAYAGRSHATASRVVCTPIQIARIL